MHTFTWYWLVQIARGSYVCPVHIRSIENYGTFHPNLTVIFRRHSFLSILQIIFTRGVWVCNYPLFGYFFISYIENEQKCVTLKLRKLKKWFVRNETWNMKYMIFNNVHSSIVSAVASLFEEIFSIFTKDIWVWY